MELLLNYPPSLDLPQAGDFEPPGFATSEFKICSSPPRLDLPQARVPGPVDTLRNPRWNHHLVSQPGFTTGWGLLHPPSLDLPQVGAPPGLTTGGVYGRGGKVVVYLSHGMLRERSGASSPRGRCRENLPREVAAETTTILPPLSTSLLKLLLSSTQGWPSLGPPSP